MAALTAPQAQALRMIDEEGSYHVNDRGNFYHDRHRPGNLYVNGRTARVLIEKGLAEVRYGRLFRTEQGTAIVRGKVE